MSANLMHAAQAFLQPVLKAYEMRVSVFGRVLREAHRMFRHLRDEQETLIMELKERLARNRSLRRKDFDAMISSLGYIREEADDAAMLALEEFKKEGRDLCAVLKKACARPDPRGLRELKVATGETIARLEDSERAAILELRRQQIAQEEINAGLRAVVLKGDGARIQDLRKVVKTVVLSRQAMESEPGTILEDLQMVREEAGVRWAAALQDGELLSERR